MPLAIKALETYVRRDAFLYVYGLADLRQTEPTVGISRSPVPPQSLGYAGSGVVRPLRRADATERGKSCRSLRLGSLLGAVPGEPTLRFPLLCSRWPAAPGSVAGCSSVGTGRWRRRRSTGDWRWPTSPGRFRSGR